MAVQRPGPADPLTLLGRILFLVLPILYAASGPSALADGGVNKLITESALRETRGLIARELFDHYDLEQLAVLGIEPLRSRIHAGSDHGLVTVTLAFSAKRNLTRHASFNPDMFQPSHAMCQGWLYLHCVPAAAIRAANLALSSTARAAR